MEQEPGQDPENDGPDGSQPPPDSSRPGEAGSPGSGASGVGASGSDADAGADADVDGGPGDDDDGESVFGPWEGLEGTLGAAREREELLAGVAAGGVWDKRPPGPELAAAVARAAGPDWRCGLATGEEMVGLLRAMAALQSWSGTGTCPMSGTSRWSTRSRWRWRSRRRRRARRPGRRGSWGRACRGWSCCCG